MDVGCYAMSMARLCGGGNPIEVKGSARIGDVSRVDELAVATCQFESGAVAVVTCGTQVNMDNEIRIYGSEGMIKVPNPWFPHEGDNIIYLTKDGKTEEIVIHCELPLYANETDVVAKYINDHQAPAPCMTWDDTLGNMKALDSWRESVGLVFDVEK